MRVKFWGVRGSIPCPGPATVRYGGNTSCIELMIEKINRLLVIDAGSGIREMGDALMIGKPSDIILKTEIFLTHTHWDHIMGLPFFAPIYSPNTQLTIYGPVTHEADSLKEILSGQWTYRYFPIRQEELASRIKYLELNQDNYDLGQGLHLKTKYLNHPLRCLGYRFEFDGKVLCTAYDTEPFCNVFITDTNHPDYDPVMAEEGQEAAERENQLMEDFVRGADLLIFDAQYTQKEYDTRRKGWGHSSMEYAIEIAKRNQVRRLALFHHDVQRNDDQMDELCRRFCRSNSNTEIFFAREGMEVQL
ncbi:MAG: MBL fold metallo-hydrolase [Desulfobacterales bacterium]